MKIIIVGLGQTGKLIAISAAKEHHEVVVVDSSRNCIQEFTAKYNATGIVGSGASKAVLEKAGANTTDLLIALTPQDELNMLSCIAAKKLGVSYTMAKISHPHFEGELDYIKEEYGIDTILNPAKATAKEIVKHIKLPGIPKVEAFFDDKAVLMEWEVKKEDPLIGKSMYEVKQFFQTSMLIVAIHRGEKVYIPNGSFSVEEGDRLEIMITTKSIKDIYHTMHWSKKPVKDIFMIGCQTVGYYLLKELETQRYRVKILECDKKRCISLSNEFQNVEVVYGDATDTEVLVEEGIAKSDACISLTGDDRTNLSVSLFARNQKVNEVIAKINEVSYEKLLRDSEIDVTVFPSSVIVEKTMSLIRNLSSSNESMIKNLYQIADGKAEAIAFVAHENCDKLEIAFSAKEFRLKKGYIIAALIRENEVIVPDGSSVIKANDIVVGVTSRLNTVRELKDFFEK